jgi:hypothetical protein
VSRKTLVFFKHIIYEPQEFPLEQLWYHDAVAKKYRTGYRMPSSRRYGGVVLTMMKTSEDVLTDEDLRYLKIAISLATNVIVVENRSLYQKRKKIR